MKLPALSADLADALPPAQRVLRGLLGIWDRLALYLPLVLMALLALLTYWMVRHAPQLAEPDAPRSAVHEVDFFMRGATIKTFDKTGRLQSQLSGSEMRHYGDNATVEVDQPRWFSVSPEGRRTQASAKHALSEDDGSEVQLLGDARVVREALVLPSGRTVPRQEFRGEFLHIVADDERVSSNRPVQFTSGADVFSANTFRYDHETRVLELEGRVRAVLAPRTSPTPARPARP